MLKVEGIKKQFIGQSMGLSFKKHILQAVDDVSLSFVSGENVSLVGESGCGKTTLARILMGLCAQDEGKIVFGDRVFHGSARTKDFRKKVRMVFQDPYASLDPRFRIWDVLNEALYLEETTSHAEQEGLMKSVLLSVGLSGDILDHFPHEFSGGERQRISIARALMSDPDFLILDEAVSSLDVLIQKEILQLLEDVQKKRAITYLFISHNLRAVKKISHKIAVMYQGRIVEYGSGERIFYHPQHEYTKQLIKAAFDYEAPKNERGCFSVLGNLQSVASNHWVLR